MKRAKKRKARTVTGWLSFWRIRKYGYAVLWTVAPKGGRRAKVRVREVLPKRKRRERL